MSGDYISRLGPYIEQMVAQKHAVGYPYKESERVLHVFDRFCAAGFPSAETITPEIGNAWAVIKPTEKTSSFFGQAGSSKRTGPVYEPYGNRSIRHSDWASPCRSAAVYPSHFFAGRIKTLFPSC